MRFVIAKYQAGNEACYRRNRMRRQTIVLLTIVMFFCAVAGFAQYTGSELERKAPENFYPNPGPGDLLIVDQLKETNRLLQQQLTLLTNQNRLLTDTLDEVKKQLAENKTAKRK
jgi:hypothetical protein